MAVQEQPGLDETALRPTLLPLLITAQASLLQEWLLPWPPVVLVLPLFKHTELLCKVLWMLNRLTVSLDSTEESWVDAGNTTKKWIKRVYYH